MSVELIGFIVLYFQHEIFASCRFSQISDQTQVLYVAAITGEYYESQVFCAPFDIFVPC
jgi:uncharacterized protein VirK/YbjX